MTSPALKALRKLEGEKPRALKPARAAVREAVRADVAASLRELTIEAIRAEVATWSPDKREAFLERSAIVEYDGGETREAADRLAYHLYRSK